MGLAWSLSHVTIERNSKMRKYDITDITQKAAFEEDVILHRIRALVDIPEHNVKAGDLGGWVESEKNLSHDGSCWIGGNAFVFQNAMVYGDAFAGNKSSIKGNAKVRGSSRVTGNSSVRDDVIVEGEATVCNSARVFGDTVLKHCAKVCEYASVSSGVITDNSIIFGNAEVKKGYNSKHGEEKPYIGGNTKIGGDALIRGNVYTKGHSNLGGSLLVNGTDETVYIGNESLRECPTTLLVGEITNGNIRYSTDIITFGPVDNLDNIITYNTTTDTFVGFGVSECYGKFKARLEKRVFGNGKIKKLTLEFVDRIHFLYSK